ncbi:MAG TPA: S-methyl-5'-thioinosine phosphorylase [Rhodocyclaceae bacterium]|nr:S-methyl-5'-thioinosine phosphorylase [Rhodocyclaceae bacterium]
MLAIIGGSGLTQLANLDIHRREIVRTPYGEPSAPLTFGCLGGKPVVFLARHGHGHTIPPHMVNYRANIWALKHAGAAERIVSVASVGSIRNDLPPGTLIVPHQILDYTHGRASTFFDGHDRHVVHVDFTEPYDGILRSSLIDAFHGSAETVANGAVYAATPGPRLETAAEINRLERDGADIVGMTGMPEAALAREAGVSYAAICVAVNWAAGRGDSERGISFDNIEEVLRISLARVRRVLEFYATETL